MLPRWAALSSAALLLLLSGGSLAQTLPGGTTACVGGSCPAGETLNVTSSSTGTSISVGKLTLGSFVFCVRAMATSSPPVGFQGCLFDGSSYTLYGVPTYAMCLGPSGGSVRVGICFMTAPHPYVRYWCTIYAPGITGYAECYDIL